MTDDSTIIPLRQPGVTSDPLTEIAREGARRMLAAALKAEADCFVEMFAHERLPDGRQRLVRHGAGPERVIQTGIGPIIVQPNRQGSCAQSMIDRVRTGRVLAQMIC